jgi:ABC-type anion transport system duplicated permease subunit
MSKGERRGGQVDWIAVLYILGGIPVIVAFAVTLFTLVRLFPSIPA